MVDTGVKYPGTIASEAVAPDEDATNTGWVGATDAGADDTTYTKVIHAAFDSPKNTHRLKCQNFDFSAIPSGATIDGILVEIEGYNDTGETVKDFRIQLLDAAGALVGDNKAVAGNWDTTPTIRTYGGATVTWNASPTAAMVKDIDFGVVLSCQATTANADVYVDYVRITVYYTSTGTTQALAGTSNGSATVTSEPIKRTRYISSQSAGATTANASILRSMNIQGSISGVATSAGSLNRFLNMASAIAGAATVESAVKLARSLASSIAGIATTNVSLTIGGGVARALSAVVNGVATVAASISRSLNFQSSIAGVATVTPSLNRLRSMASSIAGAATVTAGVVRQRGFQVLVNGVATTASSLQRSTAFKALVNGVATVQASLASAGSRANQILLKIWFALR